MKVNDPNPASAGKADASDVYEAQRRMTESADRLSEMTGDEALARTVIEYNSDRVKRALARAMGPALKGDSAVNRAEAEARASATYKAEIDQLFKEFQSAQTTHCEWEAARVSWETARSLLSMMKSTIQNV